MSSELAHLAPEFLADRWIVYTFRVMISPANELSALAIRDGRMPENCVASDRRCVGRTWLRAALAEVLARCTPLLAIFSLFFTYPAHAGPPPWQTWEDLNRLALLHPDHQGLLRSSYCPGSCRYDRHSSGDWRYLYVDGDEGVIFEEAGAGAISRIWMTMGMGVSDPLDDEISIRIYIDGSATPVVNLPLPALFDGSSPPFVPPLVGNRDISSGGNFSYVPIPYRNGCRVVLVGADEKRLWFQFNFHRLAAADGVTSFTGAEDLSALTALLSGAGLDPWPSAVGSWQSGSVMLGPAGRQSLLAVGGPASLTGLKLELEPALWPLIDLELTFDGLLTVQMPLSDFFAMGRGGLIPVRSLLVGLDADDRLYSYFPMPFFDAADVALVNNGGTVADINWEARVDAAGVSAQSGLFGAVLSQTDATAVGTDFQLLSLDGQGRLAGSFMELGSTGSLNRVYLEGDERLYIDGSPHPAVYGTGVEDFFNGGFYFDQGPFGLALHGAPYTELLDDELPTTAAYRLMLTDGITFANSLVMGLESGPLNNISMRARAVTWFYHRPTPRLVRWDTFDAGLASERERHRYHTSEPQIVLPLTALFEGEPPVEATAAGIYRAHGVSSFVMRVPENVQQVRLRRRFDAIVAGKGADIDVEGLYAASYPPVDAHVDRRWHETDIELSSIPGMATALDFTVFAGGEPAETDTDIFNEFHYELWVDTASAVCADADGDQVCDDLDACPGADDSADTDGDGIPDGCDLCDGDLLLTGQAVDSAVLYESCDSITAGDGFEVLAPGYVIFRAVDVVRLANGFAVESGALLEVQNSYVPITGGADD